MSVYPLVTFHFELDWGGTRIGFTEVSGLSAETQPITYREGWMPDYTELQMPGMKKFGPLTLKRGVFRNDNEFYEWWSLARLNQIPRRDIQIKLLDENHDPVFLWTVKNAFPTKVEGPGLNATGNEAAIETMELVHEGITFEAVS